LSSEKSGEPRGDRRLRVFSDTNILVSGMVFAGKERKLLDDVIDGKLELVLSDDVIDERSAPKEVSQACHPLPPFLAAGEAEDTQKRPTRAAKENMPG